MYSMISSIFFTLIAFAGSGFTGGIDARLVMPRISQSAPTYAESVHVPAASISPQAPLRVSGTVRPSVRAESALLIHASTGEILYAKDRDTLHPLASLTKLMTALVAVDCIRDWDSSIVITSADNVKSGRSYVYSGDRFKLKDLLGMSLVASANDATQALARSCGIERGKFVAAMNEKARSLGLRYTMFSDPTGLDHDNISTAAEVAQLLTAALAHPTLREELSRKEYRYATLNDDRRGTAFTTNKLLAQDVYEILGGKTGYIEESGYNFATLARGKNGQTFLVVVMGASSEQGRFDEAKVLLDWAEQAWKY